MMNIYEAMSNRTINVEKDLDGRMWYITDNVTDVVGKGLTRTSTLACYNRGIELWQIRQAGYGITDWSRFMEDNNMLNASGIKSLNLEIDDTNMIRVKGKMEDINNLLVGSPIKYNDKIVGIIESVDTENNTYAGTIDKAHWESLVGEETLGFSIVLSRE